MFEIKNHYANIMGVKPLVLFEEPERKKSYQKNYGNTCLYCS